MAFDADRKKGVLGCGLYRQLRSGSIQHPTLNTASYLCCDLEIRIRLNNTVGGIA
jgi:hypothetical protein